MAAINDGMSCCAAAARFGVAPSTAIRWQAQRRTVGHFEPKPQGGDVRSRRVEERHADKLALWEANRDITLEELRLALADIELAVLGAFIARRAAKPVIPNNPSRARKYPIDKYLYAQRHLIECCFSRLKQFRRVATRFEKTARNYLAIVTIAATVLWIR